jgi:site-specific recombinase XerD
MHKENELQVLTYLQYLRTVRRLSEHTITSYGHDLRLFLDFLKERNLSFTAVTFSDARRFIASFVYHSKKSTVTINRMLSSLRGFYRYAISRQLCSSNPFSRIETSPRRRRLPEVLSRQEIIEILRYPVQTFFDLRNSVMLHLFYATGCRLSELLQANIDDLDLHQQRMLVRGKGSRQRFVFINPSTQLLLERYLAERQLFIKTRQIPDTHPLLLGKRGNRLSASTVHSIFERYRVQLGMQKRFTPHMLRHSFATHMLDNNSGIRIVQELLGHASVSTTQIYTHVSAQRLRSVYEQSHPHGRKGHGNSRNNDHSSS